MPQNEGNEICAVCLSSINEKDKYKLECGHIFHTDCIIKWFRNSNGNCPCCWAVSYTHLTLPTIYSV